MGNQEIKAAMSKIQDKEFDPSELDAFEAQLWREQTDNQLEKLMDFKDKFSLDEKEIFKLFSFRSNINSELDMDTFGTANWFAEKAKDCWQTGFTTRQRMIETLKQGGKC